MVVEVCVEVVIFTFEVVLSEKVVDLCSEVFFGVNFVVCSSEIVLSSEVGFSDLLLPSNVIFWVGFVSLTSEVEMFFWVEVFGVLSERVETMILESCFLFLEFSPCKTVFVTMGLFVFSMVEVPLL